MIYNEIGITKNNMDMENTYWLMLENMKVNEEYNMYIYKLKISNLFVVINM